MTSEKTEGVPLCVDLDGTLTRTDLLWEGLFSLLKNNALSLFLLPWWLLKGKAHFKEQVAARASVDLERLPLNPEFEEFLRGEHRAGRRLVLATAANARLAEGMAGRLGFFERVVASDGGRNLAGAGKADRLVELFGEGGFDYAGNAGPDRAIWRRARRAVVVNASRRLQRQAERDFDVERVFVCPRNYLRHSLRAMRLHHWLKNLLLFVPLAAAQRADEWNLDLQVLCAFVAFGLCASSVYVLNDLVDLDADRQHPSKRRRPFAAAELPLPFGLALACGLLAAVALPLALLPLPFALVLAGYYAVTLSYSLSLKRKAVVDVTTLAALYTVRIIAGGAAAGVEISFWLLAFSIFFFFSLALVKRCSELIDVKADDREEAKGRGYGVGDLEALGSMGVASGFLSVLVLALYINSDRVRLMYSSPEVIWVLCPLLLYWISRVWLLTRRGEMDSDPVVFAARDPVSWTVGAFGLASLVAADLY